MTLAWLFLCESHFKAAEHVVLLQGSVKGGPNCLSVDKICVTALKQELLSSVFYVVLLMLLTIIAYCIH